MDNLCRATQLDPAFDGLRYGERLPAAGASADEFGRDLAPRGRRPVGGSVASCRSKLVDGDSTVVQVISVDERRHETQLGEVDVLVSTDTRHVEHEAM